MNMEKDFNEMMDFLKKEFPSYFENVRLHQLPCNNAGLRFLTPNNFGVDLFTESRGLVNEDKAEIFYDCNLISTLKEMFPIWFKKWTKKINRINKNIRFSHYVLAHELGHYLDFLDDPERMIADFSLDYQIKNSINYKIRDLDFNQFIYSTKLKTEVRANKNALKILKSLNKLGFFN